MTTLGLVFWLTQNRIDVPEGGYMGQIIFVLLVVGGLGYFFYRQMSKGTSQSDTGWALEDKPGSDNGKETKAKTQSDVDPVESDALDAQIVALVSRTPGILQTEVYTQFPEENRKSLQAVLLQMDKDGTLQREREGSSYRLFIA